MNPRGTSTLALALAPAQNGPGAFVGRATARPEDRASQGSQHHHPLKRDRRTHKDGGMNPPFFIAWRP